MMEKWALWIGVIAGVIEIGDHMSKIFDIIKMIVRILSPQSWSAMSDVCTDRRCEQWQRLMPRLSPDSLRR